MGSRIPSLDGLRALSIALVVVGHAYQGATNLNVHTPIWLVVGNAGLGVEIFFVISGFLITSLLLKEYQKFGTISLKNFYIRRIFRIIPALWVFLVTIALLKITGILQGVNFKSLLAAFTFTTNYSPWADSNALSHTWSLSVEEQFYILWPASLLWILNRFNRHGAIRFTLFLIIIAPIARLITHYIGNPFFAGHIYYMLHTRMDALMFGCLLALVLDTKHFKLCYALTRKLVGWAAFFIFIVSPLLSAKLGGAYLYTIGYSLEGACISMIIIWMVNNEKSLIGIIFNSPPFIRLGVVSYGLYLWQELMLKTGIVSPRQMIFAALASYLVAEISYALVEKPALNARLKFMA